MLPILWIVFVLFSLSCIPYVANSLDCFCFVFLRLICPMLPILWNVFGFFVFVLNTLCCQFTVEGTADWLIEVTTFVGLTVKVQLTG